MPSSSLGDTVPNQQPGYEDSGSKPKSSRTRLPQIYSDEWHTEYVKVLTRNAKCDNCESRNTACMQKCRKCGLTTCIRCYMKGEFDSRHNLHDLDLDWGANASQDPGGGKHRPPNARPFLNDGRDARRSNNDASAQSDIASRHFLVREKIVSSNDRFTGIKALQKEMSSANPDQAANAGEPNSPEGVTGKKKAAPRRARSNAVNSRAPNPGQVSAPKPKEQQLQPWLYRDGPENPPAEATLENYEILSKYWADNGKTEQERRLWAHACKMYANRLRATATQQLEEPEEASLNRVPETKNPEAAHGQKRKNTTQDGEPRTKPRDDLEPFPGSPAPGPNDVPPNHVPVSNQLPPINQLMDPHQPLASNQFPNQPPALSHAHPQVSNQAPFCNRPSVPNPFAPSDYLPPPGHHPGSSYDHASNYHQSPILFHQNPYQNNLAQGQDQFIRYSHASNNTIMGRSSTGYASQGDQGRVENPSIPQGENASMAPSPSLYGDDYGLRHIQTFNQNMGQQRDYAPGSLMNYMPNQGHGYTMHNAAGEEVPFTHHHTDARLQTQQGQAGNDASGDYNGQQNLDPHLATFNNAQYGYSNNAYYPHPDQPAQAVEGPGGDGMAAARPPMLEAPIPQTAIPQTPIAQSPASQTPAQDLQWDREAFPASNAGILQKLLVEGGINTIHLKPFMIPEDRNDSNYCNIHRLAQMIKDRMLEEDPWCRANVQVFEQQWERIRQVLVKWLGVYHGGMSPEDTLEAIAQMEAHFIMEGMKDELPRRGFWAFWIQGMKQAVQEKIVQPIDRSLYD